MTSTNSLPPLRCSLQSVISPFASRSTFLHPLWNSLQTEHSSRKQFFKVTYSTWCMLSLHRQCCPKWTNNFKYYNSLWHSKKPQYINKKMQSICALRFEGVLGKRLKRLYGEHWLKKKAEELWEHFPDLTDLLTTPSFLKLFFSVFAGIVSAARFPHARVLSGPILSCLPYKLIFKL